MNELNICLKPKFKEAVTITLSANDLYTPFLGITIQSIIANSTPSSNYDIVVLHTSITETHQSEIMNLAFNFDYISIRFCNIGVYVNGKDFYVGTRKEFSVESYYRLLIPEIFQKYTKVLYLDCDMVITRDIANLYNINIDGFLVASTMDYCSYGIYIKGGKQKNYWDNELCLKAPETYFCAGMILFNITEWRKDYSPEKILDFALSRDWKKHDQDILNVLCAQKTKLVDLSWDVLRDYGDTNTLSPAYKQMIARAEANPFIVHFTSDKKPWNTPYVPRFEYFWQYAAMTPFATEVLRRIDGYAPYKVYVIQEFLHEKPTFIYSKNDIRLIYKDIDLGCESTCMACWRSAKITKSELYLEGHVSLMGYDNQNDTVEIAIETNNIMHKCELLQIDTNEYRPPNRTLAYPRLSFKCSIPISLDAKEQSFQLFTILNGHPIKHKNFSFGKFFPIDRNYKHQYHYSNQHILFWKNNKPYLKICTSSQQRKKEYYFLRELLSSNKKANKKAVFVRLLVFLLSTLLGKKEIWLISDRTNKADDSGEAFFEFIQRKKPSNIKAYYILDPLSADYQRLKNIGPIVSPMSKKYKLLYLLASFNISTQADEININPFGKLSSPYRGLLNNQTYIFLQHGVIKEDMSRTYNRFNQHMKMFVTSAIPEYESICLNPKYGCDESITKLTGLPRHDVLYNDTGNMITIMPTWRAYLFQHSRIPGVWEAKEGFEESTYYQFYNTLLNNEKLLKNAKNYGYQICFMPHPNVQCVIQSFHQHPDVKFLGLDSRYRDVFAHSRLVVTDRSSAVIDFSYLRKPIIYCHFDDDEFMQVGNHVYVPGYFDYNQDGFGEVEYDLESTVERIIEYMKCNCQLKEQYRQRIDDFFAFKDQENCNRVYKNIIDLD